MTLRTAAYAGVRGGKGDDSVKLNTPVFTGIKLRFLAPVQQAGIPIRYLKSVYSHFRNQIF